MANTDRLISLEARMEDQLHAFGYSNNEEQSNGSGRLAGALAIGGVAAGGAAAYKNREAIKGVGRSGLNRAAGGVDAVGEQLRKRSWKAGLTPGKMAQAQARGAAAAGTVAGKLRKVSKMFSAAEVEAITDLAERISRRELELEGELREFVGISDPSPLAVFNKTHKDDKKSARDEYRAAKERRKNAVRGTNDTMDAAREKLKGTSHVMAGMKTGGVAGAGLGLAHGLRSSRGGSKKMRIARTGLNTLTGGLLGASGGIEIGGRLRKKAQA